MFDKIVNPPTIDFAPLLSLFWTAIFRGFLCSNKYSLNTMNKINQKVQANSKLLTILCKRDTNRFVKTNQNDWPGKRRPSFATNIRIRKHSESSAKLTTRDYRQSNELWRKSSQRTLMRTNQITTSARSLSLIPKKDFLDSVKQFQIHKFDTQSQRQGGSLHNEAIKSHVSKKTEKDELDDYVVDYIAFNYIGKVIDNPQLWSKYVHKKLNS